jgi:hypothetical protein
MTLETNRDPRRLADADAILEAVAAGAKIGRTPAPPPVKPMEPMPDHPALWVSPERQAAERLAAAQAKKAAAGYAREVAARVYVLEPMPATERALAVARLELEDAVRELEAAENAQRPLAPGRAISRKQHLLDIAANAPRRGEHEGRDQ